MSIESRSVFQGHPYHLVSPSPWPIITCVTLLNLTTNGVSAMHGFQYASVILPASFICLNISMFFWFRDIISEGAYIGNHTLAVQKGLSIGIALFITSEALFFLAIFWAYFHSSLSPVVELGGNWPPLGIESLNPFELPLLNTTLLLASGICVTLAHHSLIQGNRELGLISGLFTIILALVFTAFQYIEYTMASFTIADGAYGSCFYFGTGFHGLHVIIGTMYLAAGFWLYYAYISTDNHHVGFEGGILYWHFVDVVWLFLFLTMYYWGS